MSRLPHEDASPHQRVVGSRVAGSHGQFRLRYDEVVLGSGDPGGYLVIDAPSSAFVVPVFEDLTTVLVRQWRYPWAATSWEVPAGTLVEGEDPLEGARRELEEEAGLRAEKWVPLGIARGSAVMTTRQFLFLARGLTEVQRAPELYEQDMVVLRLPFAEALAEALDGGIQHSGSVTALARAARALEGRL